MDLADEKAMLEKATQAHSRLAGAAASQRLADAV
jgi:hypothetical protein